MTYTTWWMLVDRDNPALYVSPFGYFTTDIDDAAGFIHEDEARAFQASKAPAAVLCQRRLADAGDDYLGEFGE